MKTIRAIEVRQETWHLHPQGESLPPLPPPFLVLAHVQQLSATYSSKWCTYVSSFDIHKNQLTREETSFWNKNLNLNLSGHVNKILHGLLHT